MRLSARTKDEDHGTWGAEGESVIADDLGTHVKLGGDNQTLKGEALRLTLMRPPVVKRQITPIRRL